MAIRYCKKLFYVFLIIVLIVALDQSTKLFLIDFFDNNPVREIVLLPFLKIVSVWNKGISFGMFSGFESANTLFFIISICVVLVIFYMTYTSTLIMEILAYSLIIGGAIGNMIDRLMHKAVFDFIHFHINNHHFPTFNVADSSICIGAGLFMISLVTRKD